jgi:hypothetical protein
MSNWIFQKQKDFFKNFHCIFIDIPHHGKSQLNEPFSINNVTELLKDLIIDILTIKNKNIIDKEYNLNNDLNNDDNINNSDKYVEKLNIFNNNKNNDILNIFKDNSINNESKKNKVNLIGIDIGGQIILNLIAIYPELVNTAIVSGVNLKDNSNNEINTNLENKKIGYLLNALNQCKTDILDKKNENFIVRGYLAEFGIEKKHFNEIKEAVNIIDQNNLINITEESLKYKLPDKNNLKYNKFSSLLVLYGTKEYPKVKNSAKIIKMSFSNAKVYSVYRAIHLWNLINYKWFNEIAIEYIENKKINIDNKQYLEKVDI